MKTSFLLVSFLFLFVNISSVNASSVVIDKFLANPSTSNNKWIELYNGIGIILMFACGILVGKNFLEKNDNSERSHYM